MPSKVYFACSKQSAQQSLLEQCVKEIRHSFVGAAVIDSNTLDWKAILAKHGSQSVAYVDVVSQFDHIVVLEHCGFLGKGLYDQLRYAGEMNKGRWVIKPMGNGILKIHTVKNIDVNDENDWKYKYGLLTEGDERVRGDA